MSAQLEHLREHFRAVQERAKGDREQLAGELLATQRKFQLAQLQMSDMQVQAGQMQMQAEQMQSTPRTSRRRSPARGTGSTTSKIRGHGA